VLVAARTPGVGARMILDVCWVLQPGSETAPAMACFGRLAPQIPGAQGVIYDTALRGKHHQKLLRYLGWHSINKVAAKKTSWSAHKATCAKKRSVILGLLIFAIAAVVVFAAFVAMSSKRRAEEASLPPEDRLTDEQFREVEFGDDDN
jgi:hypothetical protein